MISIKQDSDSYTIEALNEPAPMVFYKNEILESQRLLEYLVYTLGLNTESCKIDVKIVG